MKHINVIFFFVLLTINPTFAQSDIAKCQISTLHNCKNERIGGNTKQYITIDHKNYFEGAIVEINKNSQISWISDQQVVRFKIIGGERKGDYFTLSKLKLDNSHKKSLYRYAKGMISRGVDDKDDIFIIMPELSDTLEMKDIFSDSILLTNWALSYRFQLGFTGVEYQDEIELVPMQNKIIIDWKSFPPSVIEKAIQGRMIDAYIRCYNQTDDFIGSYDFRVLIIR